MFLKMTTFEKETSVNGVIQNQPVCLMKKNLLKPTLYLSLLRESILKTHLGQILECCF